MGAEPHQKVVVEITRYPEPERNAEGQIVEILGDADDKGVDVLSVIRSYNIPVDFPEEVLNEAKAYPRSSLLKIIRKAGFAEFSNGHNRRRGRKGHG